MAYKAKFGPILAVVLVVGGVFGARFAYQHGYMGASTAGSAAVPMAAPLPTLEINNDAPVYGVTQAPLPSQGRANSSAPEIRFQEMAWQSQTGLNLSNGGVFTTAGSLQAKHGVNLHIVWEDDVNKQMTALVNFAAALKKNPQPTEGAHFAALMGDGTAAMIAGALKDLKAQGVDPEIIGSFGYSRGEDKLMGPVAWKSNPKLAKGGLNADGTGGLIAGFLLDGDWNIALKWAGDNGIKNNPDEKTWDPDAINWYSADDYIKAAEAFINGEGALGVCEDRPVVSNGKRTGETKKCCVNAVVTWTPGDVNIFEKKGGLASIVSTKEYSAQMPNTIIGIKQWDQANFDYVVEFLAAGFEGGDQVKAFPPSAHKAFEVNAVIWGGQQPASYWETYFHSVSKTDRTGTVVELGGSSVNNLQDNLVLYGLNPGSTNVFAATYTVFGAIAKQQYPTRVPDMLPIEKVLNTSYVQAVQKKYGAQMVAAADRPKFNPAAGEMKQVVSKKAWSINFETGSAQFTPDSAAQLKQLMDGLLIAGDLAIEIHGHTDNTGDADKNVGLSQLRANAVKAWLMQQSRSNFDADRFLKVTGHGQNVPVATNDTPTGRAKNRRVEVILGTN